MRWRTTLAAALVAGCSIAGAGPEARGDEFERLDGRTIRRLTADRGGAGAIPDLGFEAIAAIPARLADSRSALVLARTGRGNLVRLLLLAELRRPDPPSEGPSMAPAMKPQATAKPGAKPDAPDPTLEPVPVVVIERLDAFDASDPSRRLATRREVALFDNLPIDLDSGQVVPADPRFGGDLVLRGEAGRSPRLVAIGGAKLFTLDKPFASGNEAGAPPRPSPGRAVVPSDFAGRYRLFGNGQWSGALDLRVGERGVVTGQFLSDLHGSAYPVTGQVATDVPNRVRFAVALPRARQEFDGYLFAEGKGAIAGTSSLLERTAGFFAVREGGRLAPEGADLGPLADLDAGRPGRVDLDRLPDGSCRVDGQAVPLERLADALRPKLEAAATSPDAPTPWLLVRAGADARLSDLEPITRVARAAGMGVIRFDPSPAAAPRE